MRTRHALAAGLVVAGLLLAGCGGSSYNDRTDHCADALAKRTKNDNGKPKACAGVKADDYDVLDTAAVLKQLGYVDDDGNVDMSRLLTPTP